MSREPMIRGGVSIAAPLFLAAVLLGAAAVPIAHQWSGATLVGGSELMGLGVAWLAVLSRPTRRFPSGRVARARRAMLERSLRSRCWKIVRSAGRPMPALVMVVALMLSWQLLVPWTVGARSLLAREAYLAGSFLPSLPFWANAFPSGPRPALGPGARAVYVASAVMIANVASMARLSGLSAGPAPGSPGLQDPLGPTVFVSIFIAAASGMLGLVTIGLVVQWLRADQPNDVEGHPPKPTGRERGTVYPWRPAMGDRSDRSSGTRRSKTA